MLAECPKFIGAGGEYADQGTLRHHALTELWDGKDFALLDLPEDQQDGVRWACDYIRLHAPLADYPIYFERQMSFVAPDGTAQDGTPDVVCGLDIFDLKWRERDYKSQMAAYAMMIMSSGPGYATVRVHVLYGESQRAEVLEFTHSTALATVRAVYDRVNNPGAQPTPCDYCGWCASAPTCPALLLRANAIAAGRPDWELEQYHASKIETAEQAGKFLRLVRRIAKWCESGEYHIKEMVEKQGIIPEGFETKTRRGNRFIPSVSSAFPLSTLPQEEFLHACSVSFTDLVETYSVFHSVSKSTAEKELEHKLGEALTRKKSSQSLVEIKPKKD